MPGSLRSLGISHFRELSKEPPALISWGNVDSASLLWRFPSFGGGERNGLARLRSLAVTMIGRAHRSSPPQSPTTTPVWGFHPPVSPPPYVLSENWKAHLSTPICCTPCKRKNPLCRFYENRMSSVRFRGVHLVLIEVAHSLSSPTVPASIQPTRTLASPSE